MTKEERLKEIEKRINSGWRLLEDLHWLINELKEQLTGLKDDTNN